MTVREKLELKKAIDARNNDREREFFRSKKAEAIHRSVEIYADSILESIDILAGYHGADRADVLELLIDTLQAKEQAKAQEG